MPGYGRAGSWSFEESPYQVHGAQKGRFPYPIRREAPSDQQSLNFLTEAERNVFVQDFERIDTNGNGFIEETEVKALLESQLGREASSEEVNAVMSGFDRNHDGKVSFEEYMARICGPDWELDGTSIFPSAVPEVAEGDITLSDQASTALQNLQAELGQLELRELRNLKSIKTPPPILEQLFGVLLKLLGHQHLDWRHAQYSLTHPKELLKRMAKLKDMVIVGHAPWRNFETAHQVRNEWIEDYGTTDAFVERVKHVSSAAAGLARWVVAMIHFYDLINLIPEKTSANQETPEALKQLEGILECLTQEDCNKLLLISEGEDVALEIFGAVLTLLGQDCASWDQAKRVLEHCDQLKHAMTCLSHMVASQEAPAQNFANAAQVAGWADRKFADEVKPVSEALSIMCAWACALYDYYESQ